MAIGLLNCNDAPNWLKLKCGRSDLDSQNGFGTAMKIARSLVANCQFSQSTICCRSMSQKFAVALQRMLEIGTIERSAIEGLVNYQARIERHLN